MTETTAMITRDRAELATADTLGHSSVETTQVYAKIVDKMTENPTLYLEKMLAG